ncbi:MAG TPA: hypothetical protein VHC69_09285 [Polyangiaceae bacterium]|nr:hypothetical protein [Polyangiaceae bacterium]
MDRQAVPSKMTSHEISEPVTADERRLAALAGLFAKRHAQETNSEWFVSVFRRGTLLVLGEEQKNLGSAAWSPALTLGMRPGDRLAATIHTHTKGSEFSQDDLRAGDTLRVPMVVITPGAERVRVYQPLTRSVVTWPVFASGTEGSGDGVPWDHSMPTATKALPRIRISDDDPCDPDPKKNNPFACLSGNVSGWIGFYSNVVGAFGVPTILSLFGKNPGSDMQAAFDAILAELHREDDHLAAQDKNTLDFALQTIVGEGTTGQTQAIEFQQGIGETNLDNADNNTLLAVTQLSSGPGFGTPLDGPGVDYRRPFIDPATNDGFPSCTSGHWTSPCNQDSCPPDGVWSPTATCTGVSYWPSSAPYGDPPKGPWSENATFPAITRAEWKWTYPDYRDTLGSVKTAPTLWDNQAFDWRAGVPALLLTIATRLNYMGVKDPVKGGSSFGSDELFPYRTALQILSRAMRDGVQCGWSLWVVKGDGRFRLKAICADVNTGLWESREAEANVKGWCSLGWGCHAAAAMPTNPRYLIQPVFKNEKTGSARAGQEVDFWRLAANRRPFADLVTHGFDDARQALYRRMGLFGMKRVIDSLFKIAMSAPGPSETNGDIRNAQQCLGLSPDGVQAAEQSGDLTGIPFALVPCGAQSRWWTGPWAYDGHTGLVMNAPLLFASFDPSTGQSTEQWCMEAGSSRPGADVTMQRCDPNNPGQQWSWDPEFGVFTNGLGAVLDTVNQTLGGGAQLQMGTGPETTCTTDNTCSTARPARSQQWGPYQGRAVEELIELFILLAETGTPADQFLQIVLLLELAAALQAAGISAEQFLQSLRH